MTKKHIDYKDVLSDLKAKMDEKADNLKSLEHEIEELGVAISTIERLAGKQSILTQTSINSLDMLPAGIYEASAFILARKGSPLHSKELHQELINNKVIKADIPIVNVATTLYKAVKQKKNCKIKRVGKGVSGTWALSIWN